MTLDSSVMNVAIATVAEDVGTTVTGIQAAITLYTLVMAISWSPAGRSQVKSQATVQLAGGVPFLSDVALQDGLAKAGVAPAVTQAALDANRQARVDGLRTALSVLALIALVGLFVARRVPDVPTRAVTGATPAGTDGR